MAIDSGLERIFETWYDYDHSVDEDAKGHHQALRAQLIKEVLRANALGSSISDFLYVYRERYREWVIKKKSATARKRF